MTHHRCHAVLTDRIRRLQAIELFIVLWVCDDITPAQKKAFVPDVLEQHIAGRREILEFLEENGRCVRCGHPMQRAA